MQNAVLHKLQSDEFARLCRRHYVDKLWAFGSVLRDDFRPDSDVDLLVQFRDDISPETHGEAYFDLWFAAQDLFGREVDLVTRRSLWNPYLIRSIDRNKRLLYERGTEKVFA